MTTTADTYVECGSSCLLHCVDDCGAYFVEHVDPLGNNGSMYLPRYNETYRRSGFPRSLANWNTTDELGNVAIISGHWQALPTCFNPCMRTCAISNCSAGCQGACDGYWDSAAGVTTSLNPFKR